MTGSRLKGAAFAAVAAIGAIGGPAAGAGAATFNRCYEVRDAFSDQSLDTFARIVVRQVRRLAPAQTVHQVHGRFSRLDDVPEAVEMSMVTGTTVVVAGEGAQMALTRNFGRGLDNIAPGAVILDCHADQARADAREWTCKGMVVLRDSGSPVANARELRLKRVNPAKNPGCNAFDLRDD